jgi:predicted nucleic acid-binding protein
MSAFSGVLSRRVFVNSSAYYAVADPTDHHHARARATLEQLERERWRLFTTNFIIAETHALVLTRRGRQIAAAVLQALDRSQATVIVRVSARDARRAREIIAQYDDKNFSLTDATSFAVMERLRIDRAFSFDHNFAQYGFRLLAPP